MYGVCMNKSAIVLLPVADRRPAREAQEWFGDGLRLLKMRLAQWTGYSAIAMMVLFAASLLGEVVVQSGGDALLWVSLLLKMVLVNVVMVAVQSGMYRAMTRVVREGGTVRINDMLWLFSAAQRRHLLVFAGVLVGFNVLYLLVEHWLFAGQAMFVPHPQGELLLGDTRVRMNMDLLWQYALLWMGFSVLMWMLTWAVLPLMTMFAQVSPALALRYALDGMRKNLVGLLWLGVLVMGMATLAGMVIVLMGKVLPVLMMPLTVLLAIWMFPLGNFWSYAAFRHIYTDW